VSTLVIKKLPGGNTISMKKKKLRGVFLIPCLNLAVHSISIGLPGKKRPVPRLNALNAEQSFATHAQTRGLSSGKNKNNNKKRDRFPIMTPYVLSWYAFQ